MDSEKIRTGIQRIIADLRQPALEQCNGALFEYDGVGNIESACATGQLMIESGYPEGLGNVRDAQNMEEYFGKHVMKYYGLEDIGNLCFVPEDTIYGSGLGAYTLESALIVLNDEEGYELGEIADWLEENMDRLVKEAQKPEWKTWTKQQ